MIIERTIGFVPGPCMALYRSFLESCTLTNKVVLYLRRDLSKPLQRRQGPDPRLLLLLVKTPLSLDLSLETTRSIAYSSGCRYIVGIMFYNEICSCVAFV